jgi:tetratricopeptide (TPR) repeat protein/SAM-dependent methyltransferase
MSRKQRRREEKIARTEAAKQSANNPVYALQRAGPLFQSGQLDQAIKILEDARSHNPEHFDVNYGLAIIHATSGNLDSALPLFEKAVSIRPGDGEAQFNLGRALTDVGRLDEAIAAYRQSLDINPNEESALINLGNVLKDGNDFAAAADCYRRVIDLKPDHPGAQNNLGNALLQLGMLDEAFACHRRAVALDPRNDSFWAGMAGSLETLTFTSADDDLWQDLLQLLERAAVRPNYITKPIISALSHHPEFSKVLERTASGNPDIEIPYGDVAGQLAAIPLFLRIMGLSHLDDLKIERMLTVLRGALLKETLGGETDEKGLPLSAALALQCFTNEYVLHETDEEKAGVEQLLQRMATLVEKDLDVPSPLVAAIGAYRPLYSFPWARDLCGREWAGDIGQVIEQQISEPLEEQSLRPQIASLTSIQDTVSKSVREQYEENPYPRWIKTELGKLSRDIGTVFRDIPFQFDLGDYKSPESPEILVAGCGTGQNAINAASRFSNARVLAVDLSLGSLSYASRKTNEFDIPNIEYAQADILELGNLGRQFDLIESLGVLHHLGDPLAGWQVLVDLLRRGGLMKIGLYSETAGQDVNSARAMIAEKGYTASPQGIRQCRQDIIAMAEDGNRIMARLCNRKDFFSLSECRDLIFHVQEQRFTLPQIETALQSLDLKFLGFEMRSQDVFRMFKNTYPEKDSLTSLSLWHSFERDNPDTFRGMYQFWCKKI